MLDLSATSLPEIQYQLLLMEIGADESLTKFQQAKD